MRYAIVNVSTADLRRRPDHRSEMVSQGLLGAVVGVSGPAVRDGWIRTALPDGYCGWMRSWSTIRASKEAAREWSKRAVATVVCAYAEVSESRLRSAKKVRDVVLGCRVIPLRRAGRRMRIALPDGRRGWVRDEALVVGRVPPAEGCAIVRTAELFLGAPYLWGGVSPKGADCSGLVQTAFAVHGIALPRDVADQCRCGERVRLGSLEAGDLLFFGPQGKKPIHVGVSTGGRGFIHAGCPIHEAELGRGRRAPRFRFAMRVLQAD